MSRRVFPLMFSLVSLACSCGLEESPALSVTDKLTNAGADFTLLRLDAGSSHHAVEASTTARPFRMSTGQPIVSLLP